MSTTRSASPSTEDQPHPKRRRRQAQLLDDVDRALMDSFHKLIEPRAPPDAEQLFGQHVAAILWTLLPQKRAFAKLEIDSLFYNIQFSDAPPRVPSQHAPSHPPHHRSNNLYEVL